MNDLKELQEIINKTQSIINKTLNNIPSEFLPNFKDASLDLNNIIKAVNNNDMDELIKINSKYANKNNK